MKLRIKNFRSLKDTGDVEIKPITLLVGKNSAGKSSFLRTFPMLRQSSEEKTKSPILLYGNYVDFGSFRDIKPHGNDSEKDNYELEFTIDKDIHQITRRRNRLFSRRKIVVNKEDFEIKYGLEFEESDNGLIQILTIRCEFLGNLIKLKLDHKKSLLASIFVNEKEYFKSEDNIRFEDEGRFTMRVLKIEKRNNEYLRTETFGDILKKLILAFLERFFRKGTAPDIRWKLIESVYYGGDKGFLDGLKRYKGSTKWNSSIANWDIDNDDFKTLRDYTVLYDFFEQHANSIDIYLMNTFKSIKYIAPLRATAERYYRIQHLAVDQVDQNGKNLPIFLDSLSETQMTDFRNWTLENFNFKTVISKIEGHYSIKIVQDRYEINLSDMGFGYSQILPILTQLWYSSSKYDRKRSQSIYFSAADFLRKIIVIEQPELHLHPEFQAKFADAIVKVVQLAANNGVLLNLIIETHSDILVNRLGDCILASEISGEDINIVVFEKKSEDKPTDVNISQYDFEGNLKNWPLGFFSPEIKID